MITRENLQKLLDNQSPYVRVLPSDLFRWISGDPDWRYELATNTFRSRTGNQIAPQFILDFALAVKQEINRLNAEHRTRYQKSRLKGTSLRLTWQEIAAVLRVLPS